MRLGSHKILLLLFLVAGFSINAQVKVSASISPAEIGKNEYAQYRLMVENAAVVQQMVPPALDQFIILSGPNQESGMTMVNGVVKKFIALNFVLKPKRTGAFIIPAGFVRADDRDHRSNTVKLKVNTNSTGNSGGTAFSSPFGGIDPFAAPERRPNYSDYVLKNGESPVDKIKRNMLVRIETDKKTCFVGEPIVATYKLYTRLKSESNMTKNPSFNGFSVIDLQLPNDMSSSVENYEGKEYNVYVIRKVQLYPLLAGQLELGVAEIENNINFIKAEFINQNNPLEEIFKELTNATLPPEAVVKQKVILQSKPITILVKPLPEAGKPANFKGAVGNFSIESRIERNNFSTDDAGNMAIIIAGEGNMQMITAPVIDWPAGMEGFDSKTTDDLFRGTVPVSGRKSIEYPFIVSKPGNYTLPVVSFSFFNTRDGKYKTVTSKPLQITVTKGTGKPQSIATKNNSSKENYLTKFFNNRLRVVSLVAVFIIIGLITWLKRDVKQERADKAQKNILPDPKIINADEKPIEEIIEGQQNPLAGAEELLQKEDSTAFYTQLNAGLKNYLSKKFAIPAEELNRKNIGEQLDSRGINNETVVQLQTILDEIEWQLYTPFASNEKMKELYERSHDIIQLMNTYRS